MKQSILALVTAFLFGIPNMNFAQTINLGTAENFVLFSSSGAVSNVGTSRLTGNVGTNSGSNTGFGNVNGVMHTSNGTTAACKANLLTAYNQIKSTTTTSAHSPLLGNGDTLKMGVYAIAAPTTLNLNLILDAKGNSNAVFIFKIGGAFSTNALSQVVLINGAKACNVFWIVEGLVSMATGTSMKGTVIANNAAITMSTGTILEGRALTTTGAITINGIKGNTPIGCGSPILNGPAEPNLASTECYAVFSGNGSVTNSGVSFVKGDVGTNVGLTTGYDPLKVTGMIHPIPDGSTAACAADLLNVYNYLNTLAKDIELLYPAQFGQSLVLTPHTYLMNAATTFTDTLFLNAQGNTNAVFVIKINGALTTSTYAKVKLINGAKAENIYWLVKGAVNINDHSEMKGTFVCNNGAIDLKTGVKLEGRAFTTNGALSTSAVNVSMPNDCNVLPVTWLYFRGNAVEKKVLLEWATAKENNNKTFVVERSANGRNFEPLYSVSADINGNAAYQWADENPLNINYYRIKQVDKDYRFSYSAMVAVNLNEEDVNSFSIHPNPVGTLVYLSINANANQPAQIIITNAAGKQVYMKTVEVQKGNQVINLYDLKLSSGTYFISLVFTDSKLTRKLIKL